MATREDIPTDLALEIGTNLNPKKFVAAARHFFDLIEALAGSVPDARPVPWEVIAREGSTVLAVRPKGEDASLHSVIYERISGAARALAEGDIQSARLDDRALDHAKALAELAREDGRQVPIRIWVNYHPVLFGSEVAEFIREDRGSNYTDHGTLEGHLSAIQDSRGALEFKIRDLLYTGQIRCVVADKMLEDVLANFRHRVEVAGEIQYRRDGTPTSITAERIERLPDDSDLPSAEDVRGILALGAG